MIEYFHFAPYVLQQFPYVFQSHVALLKALLLLSDEELKRKQEEDRKRITEAKARKEEERKRRKQMEEGLIYAIISRLTSNAHGKVQSFLSRNGMLD